MQIIGDRHYKSDPGEQITFAVGVCTQTGAVTVACSCEPGTTLPLKVEGSGHRTVAITAGFTANDGGSADIVVSGTNGGGDTSKIRQLTGLPFRSGIFVID
jgi:hypothetical protein